MTDTYFTIRRIDQDGTDGIIQASCMEHLIIGIDKFCKVAFDADCKEINIKASDWDGLYEGHYFTAILKQGRDTYSQELFITRSILTKEHEYIEGIKSKEEVVKEAIETLNKITWK